MLVSYKSLADMGFKSDEVIKSTSIFAVHLRLQK